MKGNGRGGTIGSGHEWLESFWSWKGQGRSQRRGVLATKGFEETLDFIHHDAVDGRATRAILN